MKQIKLLLLIFYTFLIGTGAFAQFTVPGVTNVLYYEPFSFNNYDGVRQYEASTLVGFFAVGATVSGPITTDNTWAGNYAPKSYNSTGNGDVGGLVSFSNGTKVTDVTFSGINIAGSSAVAISFGLAQIYTSYDHLPLFFASVDGGPWFALPTPAFGTHWPTSDLPASNTFTGIILPVKDLNGNLLVGSTLSINIKQQANKDCEVDDLSVLEFTPVSSISIAGPSTFSTPAGTFAISVTGIAPSDAADKTYTWSISGGGAIIDQNTGIVTPTDNGTVNIVALAKDGSGVVSNLVSVVISGQSKPASIVITATSNIISSFKGTTVLYASVLPAEAPQTVTWGINVVTGSGVLLTTNGNWATVTGIEFGNGIYDVWATALNSTLTGIYTISVSGQVAMGVNEVLYFQNFNYFSYEAGFAEASTIPGFSSGSVTVKGPLCLTPFVSTGAGAYFKPHILAAETNDGFVGLWGDKVNNLTFAGINIANKVNLYLSFYLAQQYVGVTATPTISVSLDGGPWILLTATGRGTTMGIKDFGKTFTGVSMPIQDANGNKLTGSVLSINVVGVTAIVVNTASGSGFSGVPGAGRQGGQLDDLKVTGDEPGSVVTVTGITISASGTGAITTKGGTLQLQAIVLPVEATNRSVTWSIVTITGNATISGTGLVTAKGNGTVKVIATAADGSGVMGEFIVTITGNVTAVENGIEVAAITIYPNPTSSSLTIDADNIKGASIYDIYGKLVKSVTSSKKVVDVAELEAGTYLIYISTGANKVTVKRFVKN